jgi:hypothetical protein
MNVGLTRLLCAQLHHQTKVVTAQQLTALIPVSATAAVLEARPLLCVFCMLDTQRLHAPCVLPHTVLVEQGSAHHHQGRCI